MIIEMLAAAGIVALVGTYWSSCMRSSAVCTPSRDCTLTGARGGQQSDTGEPLGIVEYHHEDTQREAYNAAHHVAHNNPDPRWHAPAQADELPVPALAPLDWERIVDELNREQRDWQDEEGVPHERD